MKTYILAEPHFIGGTLLAAGSRVSEADLTVSGPNGKQERIDPGDGLIEVDPKGQPKSREDAARLQALGVSAQPIEVAPVAPHAPNPTMPQALPPHAVGEALPPGEFVPADGVESDEARASREAQRPSPNPQRRKR